jgi:hypothetical protein
MGAYDVFASRPLGCGRLQELSQPVAVKSRSRHAISFGYLLHRNFRRSEQCGNRLKLLRGEFPRPPTFAPARARAALSPAMVRSRIRLRSNSAFCGAPQNAEFERDVLRERVRAGLALARKKGKTLGRPAKAREKTDKIRQLFSEGISKNQIAQHLHIGRASVFRALSPAAPECDPARIAKPSPGV